MWGLLQKWIDVAVIAIEFDLDVLFVPSCSNPWVWAVVESGCVVKDAFPPPFCSSLLLRGQLAVMSRMHRIVLDTKLVQKSRLRLSTFQDKPPDPYLQNSDIKCGRLLVFDHIDQAQTTVFGPDQCVVWELRNVESSHLDLYKTPIP